MPELPEVETVCRGLYPAMVSRQFEKIVLHRKNLRIPFPKDMDVRLKDRRITSVSRRAKYIFIHVQKNEKFDDDILVIHLGMSGQITIAPNADGFKPAKHDHMVLYLNDGSIIAFNDARRFGMVMLETEKDLPYHPVFLPLGPEPLGDDFTKDVLYDRLRGKKSSIKTALLDQHVLAGVGNIYASEALFIAGISPQREAGDVSLKKAGDLVLAIKNVLRRAIEAGGSTLKDYKKVDGSLGYFQHSFAVYGREGHPCPRCSKSGKQKNVIEKIMQSGRATYYCPKCQA